MTGALRPPLIAAITDRRLFGRTEPEALDQIPAWASAVAAAGADIIQIRERGLTDATLLALVRQVLAATAGTACRVLVNDRADVALAAGAAGVHLPEAGLPSLRVRRIAPAGFAIGRSVHSPDDAFGAGQEGGCDYLLFGTVFESASKPSGHAVAGLDGLRKACASVALPVLAVGGVSVDRGEELARAGAAGVAAIRLFVDPWHASPGGGAAVRLAEIVGALREAFVRRRMESPASAPDPRDGS